MLGFFRKLFREISVPFAIISNFPEFWLEWELSRVRLSSLPEIPESDVSFATGNKKNETGIFRRMDSAQEKLFC